MKKYYKEKKEGNSFIRTLIMLLLLIVLILLSILILLYAKNSTEAMKQELYRKTQLATEQAGSNVDNIYKKRVVFFIHKKWLSFGLVAASIVLLMFFMKTTPTGIDRKSVV